MICFQRSKQILFCPNACYLNFQTGNVNAVEDTHPAILERTSLIQKEDKKHKKMSSGGATEYRNAMSKVGSSARRRFEAHDDDEDIPLVSEQFMSNII